MQPDPIQRHAADHLLAVLHRIVLGVSRRPGPVLVTAGLLTLALGAWAATHLGVNGDNKRMISDQVEFMRSWRAFAARFPTLDDSLLVVVDAETPELCREAASALAERLEREPALYSDVFQPGEGSFFERNGMLYQSVGELEQMADRLVGFQPVIAELAREPTLANIAELIGTGLSQVDPDDSEPWPAVLDHMGDATVAVFEEHPIAVSWESLFFAGSTFDPQTRRVIIVEPILDFDSLLPATAAIEGVRRAAQELRLSAERGVRVRVTGNPALSDEEMRGLIFDVLIAGSFSFVLVAVVLRLAFRAWRIVLAAAVTLLVGLVWTAAFAAAAVGDLNMVSIAFAVLFVGLGVDFSIHLGLHYANARRLGAAHEGALREAIDGVGLSLVLCTITTAIGFFAFVPTDFRGVGELGLISGCGMFVILLLTLTLFPAVLSVGRTPEVPSIPAAHATGGWLPLHRLELRPGLTAAVAAALGLGGLVMLPDARFDSNVIELRSPESESVRAFQDLLAESRTTPWTIDAMARDLTAAQELAASLDRLPGVERTVTLADYVPTDQEEKLAILEDLALLFDAPSFAVERGGDVTEEEKIAALQRLDAYLSEGGVARADSPLEASALRLQLTLSRFLERIEAEEDAEIVLAELETLLLVQLPELNRRLIRSLDARPVGLEDIPEDLRRRMLAPDGWARVQIFPDDDLGDPEARAQLVDAVRSIAPDATGLAVNIESFGRTTARSLVQATALALLAITVVLTLVWRHPAEVLLVLTPLVLAAVFTVAAMITVGMPFNFANVIVIPLLLGMGVDGGVHLVARSHRPLSCDDGLVGTVAARAVLYSAATTIASFGSLAMSSHRGIASLGVVLVVGMVFSLACNLGLLPSLVALRQRWRT